jgi:hypothetical protein
MVGSGAFGEVWKAQLQEDSIIMKMRRMHGARFRQKFTLEDPIELHAFAPLEALACV